eukprot:gene69343-biopygen24678
MSSIATFGYSLSSGEVSWQSRSQTGSPLNVVHVGLEMLVSLINSADLTSPFISIDRDTADFIKQMFFSSESAINILNDLLQYEHIEAG